MDLSAWDSLKSELWQKVKEAPTMDPRDDRPGVKSLFVMFGWCAGLAFLRWIGDYDSDWILAFLFYAFSVVFVSVTLQAAFSLIPSRRLRCLFSAPFRISAIVSMEVAKSLSAGIGAYIFFSFSFVVIGGSWIGLYLILEPATDVSAVVYLTLTTSTLVFSYVIPGIFRKQTFRVIEALTPSSNPAQRGALKSAVLNMRQLILFLTVVVTIIVNVETFAEFPFLGKYLASMTQTNPGLWLENIWTFRLRDPLNAALVTFVATDTFVATYRPGWIPRRRQPSSEP